LAKEHDRRDLAELLRDHRAEILRAWIRRILDDERCDGRQERQLEAELPGLFDEVVDDVAAFADEAESRANARDAAAAEHGRLRALEGEGVGAAIREMSHLRLAILDCLVAAGSQHAIAVLRLIATALDERVITLAEEMERTARERGRRHAELLDEAHDAVILWTFDRGIRFWNRGARELYGWTSREAAGRSAHELLRTEAPVPVDEMERIVREQGRWEGQLGHTAKDGTRLLVDSRMVLVRDEHGAEFVFETNRDATERARAERARRESEARLRAMVDTAVDAIVTIDERGIIETYNPAAERIFGYRAQEVVGKNVGILMPEPHRSRHDRYLARYLETGERHVIGVGRELTGRHKSGFAIPIDIAVAETWMGDRRIFTGIMRDITDRKRAEEERERMIRSERAARTDAERAARLRDEFVATVSHELRTPLNAILGWTALLRSGKLDDATSKKAIEVVERNARVQAQVVEDLLDVSRIGSGKLRLEPRPVNLAAVVEHVVASHVPAAAAKGVAVEKHLEHGASSVHGDPGRLEQVVTNLLSNAIKFTPAGGRVDVVQRRVGSRIEIVVRDTGNGIDADFLPFVFDRFRQADASPTRQHRGLGLGLALVKFLVEQHGGEIRADSPGEGQGATFTVTLPLLAKHPAPDHAPSPIHACGALGGIRVLVVDDEEDARTLVRHILEDCQAFVATAASTTEALEQLPRIRPDVLICDIGMPELDGYHLIRTVRALPPEQGGKTPAVALTAFARPEDRRSLLRAGYQMHLAKPIDQAEFVIALANLTGRLDVEPPRRARSA
jgi:PAS domain S-box-containing protein